MEDNINGNCSIWKNLTRQTKSIGNDIWSYVCLKPLNGCLWFACLFIVILIAVMAIWADASPQWVGFGAYDESAEGPRAKTLWDWMELLIVPATLVAGAFLLGKWQAENERRRAKDNQRQVLLDSYIDKMSELLLQNDLQNSKSDEVNSIARIRTLAVFRQIDGNRKGNALQFLYETGLINGSEPVVQMLGLNLDDAVLNGASLRDVNLAGTYCMNASLKNANFSNAILTGCTFTNSDMQSVDFSGASLDQAILSGCNLINANFTDADLYMADFRGASVRVKQLIEAKSLEFAILPNGSIYQGELTNKS